MALLAAFNGNTLLTLVWIIAGAIFDFCDGAAARLLKANSPLGLQLDSLSDLITFGLAPSLLCYSTLRWIEMEHPLAHYVPLLGFILVLFAALRLAKFNVDNRQTTSFRGLAVPANALFWCGFLHSNTPSTKNVWVIISLILLFSYLMISEIPMFSLKFKNFSWRENRIRFIFLATSLAILCLLGIDGISAVIVWYIILSILTKGEIE